MSRAKVLISILVVLILITLSGASVWAAPNGEDPSNEESISGEVQEIVIEDDTVLVTLVDELGETQTVRLSKETAITLKLVEEDADGNLSVNELMQGETVEIELADVIDDGEEDEAAQHPVASALADFFNELLGLPDGAIMEYHEDGMGFGVIAQACWMASKLYDPEAEDSITLSDILDAKKSGDFTSIPITLSDGTTTTAKNWGQFRKAVLGKDKGKNNLGAIMSGRANGEQEQEEGATATSNQGKNKKGKGPGEDGPPGKSKDKGSEGGGPPAEPPGQGKDKDKGGGGGGGGKGKNK